MIVGVGSDVVVIDRIERLIRVFGQRFIQRVYTVAEQQEAERFGSDNYQGRVAYYARRFAAKEAFSKALGTGFRNGLAMRHVNITSVRDGKPQCTLLPEAQHFLEKNVLVHISLSDDYPIAQALVILEKIAT